MSVHWISYTGKWLVGVDEIFRKMVGERFFFVLLHNNNNQHNPWYLILAVEYVAFSFRLSANIDVWTE